MGVTGKALRLFWEEAGADALSSELSPAGGFRTRAWPVTCSQAAPDPERLH